MPTQPYRAGRRCVTQKIARNVLNVVARCMGHIAARCTVHGVAYGVALLMACCVANMVYTVPLRGLNGRMIGGPSFALTSVEIGAEGGKTQAWVTLPGFARSLI